MLGNDYFSIQETVEKCTEQIKDVKFQLGKGQFHPEITNVFKGQTPAVQAKLRETFNTIPLHEFLAKSGTTGIAGAAYLVPTAVHTHLMGAVRSTDKVPLFSAEVVDGWVGGDLTVDVAVRSSELSGANPLFKWVMHPKVPISGAGSPTETVESISATLSPKAFNVAPRITNDLIEDNNFELVEWHLTQAAHQLGQYATDLAIADLKAASDGTGTQSTVTAGADTTTTVNVTEAIEELGSEFWNPNTMIVTYKAWVDAINVTASHAGIQYAPLAEGYDVKFQMLDTVFNNSKNLHAGVASSKMTNCVTLVLDRTAALLCGRKRWMRIDNYSEPVRDLAGAVVSCRQDCVTLYKDACSEITEA